LSHRSGPPPWLVLLQEMQPRTFLKFEMLTLRELNHLGLSHLGPSHLGLSHLGLSQRN
jgi:hypothetical protein